MRGLSILLAAATTLALADMAGCVLRPTESQQVVDLRPQISFRFDASNPARAEARVLVDGLDAGSLGEFAEGKATLRVLSGNHVVRVVAGGQTLLEERAYLGEGVTRAFAVR
jgi:hypothetical protein